MAKRTSWKVRMGKLIRVVNKGRKAGANLTYLLTKIQDENGYEFYALFTDHQIDVALARAEKNPEDVVQTTWLRDMLD